MGDPREPKQVIEETLIYAQGRGWIVIKSTGGSAHAWGVMRCAGDCSQVSVFSTPRVPENHARALRRSVDRCPHNTEEDDDA
jgi:hypothetical protein